jgi:hypothetical protein
MVNPFYVAPLGGMQTYRNVGNSIADGINRYQENQALEQEQAKKQQLMQQASQVLERGDSREIAQFSIANPEIGKTIREQIKFASDETDANMMSGMQQIISGANPEQVLNDRATFVESQGGDATQTRQEIQRFREDPEGYVKQMGGLYAFMDPEGSEAFGKATAGPGSPKFGNVQPGDFTPGSLQQFSQTGNYTDLQRYESAKSVNIGGVPHVFDPAFGGYRPASVSSGGAPVNATAQSVGASEGEIAAAVDTAKAEVKTPKDLKDIRMNIDTSEEVSRQTDSLLNNQGYISSITGINGKLPKIPGSEGFDAQIAFEQLKNTLTLGNLDKMSGVLSETDIKILSSAASGLELGMSESALKDRLGIISRVFKSKTIEERRKLEEIMSSRPQSQSSGGQKMTDESADDFINSVLGQ